MRTTRGAIQWQNTELCIDVWCECGEDLHYDGITTGRVECPVCFGEWVLELTMRTPDANDYPHDPTPLVADEDHER